MTGLLEIGVTFSSGVCKKTSVTQYHGKTVVWSFLCAILSSFSHCAVEGVLTCVSVSSTTLIIDSIGSGEEYRIVATFTNTSTELVNVPFTPIIEHDLGDRLMDNTEYSITVRVVDMTSGTVIDERTVMFTTPSETLPEPNINVIDNTHCTCGAVDKEDDENVIYIAVGVSCGVLLGLVVGIIATVLVVVLKKKIHQIKGRVAIK